MLFFLYGYLFLYIERPWEVWLWLAPYRIERIYMILAMAAFALWGGKELRWSAHAGLVVAFLALHYILAPFAFLPDAAFDQAFEYLKLVVPYFLMVWGIRNEEELKKLVAAYVGAVGVYMLHSLREYLLGRHFYRMGIHRMIGVDQFGNDPNTFAATIVLSLPFAWLFFRSSPSRTVKLACLAYGALALVCVVLTGSRAGFVTLSFWVFLLVWNFKGKKKFLALATVLLLAFVGWHVMPEEKRLRMETIWNPDAGPSSAEVSAQGRIEGLKAGLRTMARHPLTGVGPGGESFMAYRAAKDDGSPTQTHNILGEVLGEMGLPGGLLFFAQVVITFLMARRAGKILADAPPSYGGFLLGLASACKQAILLLLVSGIFGHNLYRVNWLWVGAWSFLCLHFVQTIAQKRSPSAPNHIQAAGLFSIGASKP